MKLELILTHHWFDQHVVWGKSEDYRDLTAYWARRLCVRFEATSPYCAQAHCDVCARWSPKHFDQGVVLRKGYSNKTATKPHLGTSIGTGRLAWGAPQKKVFILTVGSKCE